MRIRIKKNRDGAGSLSCQRDDGSTTWQRQRAGLAAFYAHHDLTHYAVETVLGCTQAFFGLVAAGWEINSFGPPWPKGPLPAEAARVELIVGFLDVERASAERWSAAEFNRQADTHSAASGSQIRTDLTADQLDAIRKSRAKLFERWDAVEPGDTLELPFPPPAQR